jgi:hypothetical protein
MPNTYHDFDPWRRAAENISQGLIAAQQARAQAAARQQEMQMRQPLIAAQTDAERAQARHYDAQTGKATEETTALKMQREARGQLGDALAQLAEVNETGEIRIRPGTNIKDLMGAVGRSASNPSTAATAFSTFSRASQRPGEEAAKLKNARDIAGMKDATTWDLGLLNSGDRLTLGTMKLDSAEKIAAERPKSSGVTQQKAMLARSRADNANNQRLKFVELYGKPDPSWAEGSTSKRKLFTQYSALLEEYAAAKEELDNLEKNPLTTTPPMGQRSAAPATNAAPVLKIVRGPDGKLTFAPQ